MDEDLDAFIADIEQTAPVEEIDHETLRCKECNAVLDDVEGDYICPNCGLQATNILQLEETEMHFDASGRPILGQRAKQKQRSGKYKTDYGWAWSTDEAIVHILCEQLKILERIGLINRRFSQGNKNMWLKFWVENIEPFIKDNYDDGELVDIETYKNLKMRDVEVLVKVKDKVMIPKRQKRNFKRIYRKPGARFSKYESVLQGEAKARSSRTKFVTDMEESPMISLESEIDDEHEAEVARESCQTSYLQVRLSKDLNRDTISVLTLNRTIAFIEATARIMNWHDPIFASDLVRACNQRVIPFFGAHKILPEGMNCNHTDVSLFQRIRPPSATQLTRAATYLIYKVYGESLPAVLPVPDSYEIIERFVIDMNLPNELMNLIREHKIDFSCFQSTRPIILKPDDKKAKTPPQYNRWAFAILLCLLKKIFNLGDGCVHELSSQAEQMSVERGEKFLVLRDWMHQMSLKLQLIMSYDPFVMLHPMADIRKIEPTPQVYKYIEAILNDKLVSTTRQKRIPKRWDASFRTEFAEFLHNQLPRPKSLKGLEIEERDLEQPIDFRLPIKDAFERTKRFWSPTISQNEDIMNLLMQDFSNHKIHVTDKVKLWSLYDQACSSEMKDGINTQWPSCFKLLLHVGGYLCYCEPQELLRQINVVEEYLYPMVKVIKKRRTKA